MLKPDFKKKRKIFTPVFTIDYVSSGDYISFFWVNRRVGDHNFLQQSPERKSVLVIITNGQEMEAREKKYIGWNEIPSQSGRVNEKVPLVLKR